MMLPQRTKEYLLVSLKATPLMVRRIVATTDPGDPRWDISSDDRFTPREVVAHLADWDSIFLERLRQTVHEDLPTLYNVDESQRAIERGYAASDPVASAALFQSERARTLEYLEALSDEQWQRVGRHSTIG